MANIVMSADGVRGRHIDVYPFKLVIQTKITAGSLLTKNATDGTKTIYFTDIIGVQYKKPGLAIGYLQFETASALGNNDKDNFFNENTFTFDKSSESDAERIYEYVIAQLDAYKSRLLGSYDGNAGFSDVKTGAIDVNEIPDI